MTPNIHLAHHWLTGMRGGEKVLTQFSLLFPHAPIHTLVANPSRISAQLAAHDIRTSKLQAIPGGASHYKKLLPLFPMATASLKISHGTPLLLSSDASVIKGLSCPEDVPHVCYCHSPPRYLWDLQQDYMNSAEAGGPIGRMAFRSIIPHVRRFDQQAARRVTHFIANSHFVQQRIRNFYNRDSVVIHPPVELDNFAWQRPPENFYLIVSQLVPYKRIDIAVDAFTRMNKPLVVIGEGSERKKLEARAGRTILFMGAQPFPMLKEHYERCRAFIFPGIEDFGITPLEAQASGKPVIAYGAGGALETIKDGVTGVFFHNHQAESLREAVEKFESMDFDPKNCRLQAEIFSPEHFRNQMKAFLTDRFPSLFSGHPWSA